MRSGISVVVVVTRSQAAGVPAEMGRGVSCLSADLLLSLNQPAARRMETTEPEPAVKQRQRGGEHDAFVRRAWCVCCAVVVYEQRQLTAVW